MKKCNREYNYFGNVLEYEYFASYSNIRVLKKYSYSSTITPSLVFTISYFHHDIQIYDYRVTNVAVLVIWFITFIN